MTSAQVVKTSVTNNSSFLNYTHPDDHTTDTPGFKPFTILHMYTAMVEWSYIQSYLVSENITSDGTPKLNKEEKAKNHCKLKEKIGAYH